MRVFKILFTAGFKKLIAYPRATLINFISSIIFLVAQYYLWYVISQNSDEVQLENVFFYIVISNVLSNLYPNGIGGNLASQIKNGNIAFTLLRPCSLVKQIVYENMGTSFYKFLFYSCPTLILGILLNDFNFVIKAPFLFIVFLVLSFFLCIYINFLFSLLQFITSSNWGISSLKYAIITIFSGKFIPLKFYPDWSLNIINKLPFRYLYNVPIEILIGEMNENFLNVFVIEISWVIILYLLFHFLFDKALKKITIAGG